MPDQQDTFKLVPTTLVNKTVPRPPMTSKAAKKAYREANKLPKISRAEQRRIEAAEIARQKKEYEKEKAAARAKAAREKKLKKEAEERAKRKELGLPEPSRFVRPSQPTIKTFVKSAAGQKRSREEANSMEADDSDTTVKGFNDKRQSEEAIMKPAKRMALKQADDDNEFGDFPSLSQADLPTLFAEVAETYRAVSIELFPSGSPGATPQSQSIQCEFADHISITDQLKLDAQMAERQLLTEATLTTTTAPSPCHCQPSTVSPKAVSSSRAIMTDSCAQLSSTGSMPHLPTITPRTTQTSGPRESVGENPTTMLPPTIPMTVNRVRLRAPLNETSRNMALPPRPQRVQAVISIIRPDGKPEKKLERNNSSMPPPSTLAFLEAHLEDFFPSPSQQVRELLEEVDDMPSNTQIAREIDLDKQDGAPVRTQHTLSPLTQSQKRIEDETLHFLSSQDLEISSQDLRDIDTPSKAMPKGSLLQNSTTQALIPSDVTPEPPPTPKLKPRFFEEKEDDLIYAALHESLLLSKQTTQSSSPRRPQRILRRTQSAKTDHSHNDYGSDCSDLDADFIALLDDP